MAAEDVSVLAPGAASSQAEHDGEKENAAPPPGWQRDEVTGKLKPIKGESLAMSFSMGPEPAGTAPTSLQERFSQFRSQKLKAAKHHAALFKQEGEMRKDPAAMEALRQKFIDGCKAYYGVPYAQRYHEPGTEHHGAPLYLDCCGLVRQVLRDLRDDFGFTPGPWNQAYQFDTLPVRYDSWEQMRPGDLVFAEGTYIKPGMKPQKGDIVHVEVCPRPDKNKDAERMRPCLRPSGPEPRPCAARSPRAPDGHARSRAPPPPLPPVLTGHASSLLPY